MPTYVNNPTIQINSPTGTKTISNPLYTFKYHPWSATAFPSSDGPVSQLLQTERDPGTDGANNVTDIDAQMSALGFTSYAYQFFSRTTSYPQFATTRQSGQSLENVHGAVHNFVGGTAQMTYLGYAGFDPIL
jgi:tyrosinase